MSALWGEVASEARQLLLDAKDKIENTKLKQAAYRVPKITCYEHRQVTAAV